MEQRQKSQKSTWFVLTQHIVVAAAVFALTIAGTVVAKGHIPSDITTVSTGLTVGSFLAVFVIATFVLLLLLRSRVGAKVFAFLFGAAVLSGIWTLADVFWGPDGAIMATSAAVLGYAALRNVLIFDLVVVIGLAGVATLFGGAMRPTGTAIILGLLSVYDVIAVYGTRHMVAMGKRLLQGNVPFGFVFPNSPRLLLAPMRSVIRSREQYVFLGTGDVVLPALLIAAVAREGELSALFPLIGAMVGIGVSLTLFLGRSRGRPMPALPPVALGAILGYVVTLLW